MIYGVDTEKPLDALNVRDAVVECFKQAHKEQLDELLSFSTTGSVSKEEEENMRLINIKELISQAFKKTGGDFEYPTKDSILNSLEEVKKFAGQFRNQEIIKTHYNEILKLINMLN